MIYLVIEGVVEQVGRTMAALFLAGVALGGGAVLIGVAVTAWVLA